MNRFATKQEANTGRVVSLGGSLTARLAKSISGVFKRLLNNRRAIRSSLVICNLLLLATISFFTIRGSQPDAVLSKSVLASGSDSVANPIDQLSSADIAVNVAAVARLPEATAVTNQAQSVEAELSVAAADSNAVAKPQTVATSAKTRQDIQAYTVQSGDTVASIAAKFNITSDAIMWSNSLRSSSVNAGTVLQIPPISGIIYTVQNGDSPDSLAQKYRSNKDQIIDFNDIELTGLRVGERIVIPNGQQPAPIVRRIVAVYGPSNGYDYGFCTWYVADQRAKAGRPLPTNLGDAWTWDDRAASAGMRVDRNPEAGAAVVTSSTRRPGHVAYVESVNADGSVWISEMNSRGQVSMTDSTPTGGWGRVDWKLLGAAQASGLNYIH